uniref:Uncharacterized protein n=1 Tax=Nelumbo nucifera TaxID=4432 RepID=A0A822Z139_NELNU|nr:TPA_asm: hypothetical protein HUJ06_014437 [Nelumbo nucifera]
MKEAGAGVPALVLQKNMDDQEEDPDDLSLASVVNTLYAATRFFLLSSGSLEVENPLPLPLGPLKLYELDLSFNPNPPPE